MLVIFSSITFSHCPYYAGESLRLDCPGKNIFPKIFRYTSEAALGQN